MTQWTLWGAHQLATSWFSKTAEVPGEYYLALMVETEPDPFVTGLELDEPVEDSGYARLWLPNDSSVWGTNQEAVITTSSELRFPEATTDWGSITYWALCSAPTGGYVYLYGEFVEAQQVFTGDEVVIDPQLMQMEFSEVYGELSVE